MQALSVTYGPATCHVLRLHSKEREGAEDGDPPGPNPWRQVRLQPQETFRLCFDCK